MLFCYKYEVTAPSGFLTIKLKAMSLMVIKEMRVLSQRA